jgi:hypothetical protein
MLTKPNEVAPTELDIPEEQSNYKLDAPTVLIRL